MRKMLLKSMAAIVAMFTCLSASAIDKLVKTTTLDGELTSVEDLYTTKFILENENGQVLCTPSEWDIKVGSLGAVIGQKDQGLYFLAETPESADVPNCAVIGVYNVDGSRRTFWAGNQCVNAQPSGDVIFGLSGTSPNYGQDAKNHALWTMEYVAGKGFTFHCVGRDVYIGYDSEAARPSETAVYWKAYKSYSAGYDKASVNAAVSNLDAAVKIGEISNLLSSAKAAYESSNDIVAFGDALNKVIDAQNGVDAILASYANLYADLKGEAAQAKAEEVKTAYGNGEYATVSELEAALSDAAKLQTEAGANMTGAIINPSFENGTLEGWVSTNGGAVATNYNFGHRTGDKFVERWTNSNNGGKLSDGTLLQTLTGMPNGTYTLTAEMQNLEQGNNSANGTGYYLVINDDKTAVQTAGETVSVTSKVKDGTLVIGAKLEGCSGNWVCIDNFQLTFVAPLAPGEDDATEEDLKPLMDEISYAKTLGVDVAAWLEKTYTVAEIAGAINEVKVAEYAAVKANYSMDASVLIPAVNTWEGTLVSNKGQHWDGTASSIYYEQTGAQWGASSWDASSKQTVKLPKGKYVVYAAGRASSGSACKAYIKVNDVTAEFASNGDSGKGVNTKGEASYAEDDTYANNNNGRGFEYRYIPFEVTGEEGEDVEITIGGSATAAHQWMSVCAPVLLTTSDNAAIVKDVLASDVKAAQAIVEAKAGVGDGLFQIPTEAYDTFAKAVEAAQAVVDNADATVADVEAAQKTLAEAKAAYEATPVTAPAADEQYVVSLKTSDENSPFELNIASDKISIAAEGTPVTFVAVEGGYAVSNGKEYVAYAGGNTWSLKASADDAYAWTIAAVDGGYTIQGKNGFLGTNLKGGSEAGSSCYGNKKAADGFYIWTIDEYVAPEPALAAIADDATVTLPEGELEADEDGFVKATLAGKITVDESIASDAQAFLMYTLTEKTEEAGGEIEPAQAIKGGGLFDKDETDVESAELQFDQESQEVLLPVEAGKKYTLTVKSIVVNYYDEDVEDMVIAAEKTFEGDNAIVIDFATKAAEEPEDPATYVEIAQTVDDAAGATLATKVENDGVTEYTFDGGICVAFKMLNVDVKGYDRVVIKFAEPVPAGLKASFVEGQGNEEITEGSTEWVNDLSKNTAVKDGIIPQITLLTIFAQAGKVAKVEGVYLVKDSKPELATIKSFEISKWPGEAFNNENMTYAVVATCSADVDESVEKSVVKVKGILKSGEESKEIVSNDIPFTDIAESVSAEIALPVEYGKSYTFDVTSVGVYSVSEEEGAEPELLTEKTYAEGENSVSFDIPEAPKPELATIADYITVTLPEGELEADEDGFVKATLTGKITVDESIASDAQAFLMYTLDEKTEDAGGEDEPVQAIKGGGLFDKDETDVESAELQFDQESQEVLIPVEAGKKYTLTVKSIVVSYYDEDVEDMVTAAEKKFEGDDAIVVDFATKEEAPVLAELAFVALKAADDAAIDEEDGTFPVTFSYALNVHESIAAMASGTVYYTVQAVGSEETIKGSTDFDVAKEERTIYVPGLDYSTKYVISVDSVIISYFDTETFEEKVAGKFTEPTAAVSFTTNAKPEEPIVDKGYIEIAQTVDDPTGATIATKVENDGVTEYTFDGGICVAFKMVNVDVKDYDYVVIKFAEPVPAGLKASFVEGQGNEDIKEGSKEWVNDLSKNTAVKDGIIPQITLLTIFGQAGNTAKVEGVYLFKKDAFTGIDGINAAKAADGKYIENGKVVIVKNGKKISVAGFGIK